MRGGWILSCWVVAQSACLSVAPSTERSVEPERREPMPWSEWILTAVTAVSLGDSYAVKQTAHIEEQLDIPTVEIARGGTWAEQWDRGWE